MRINESRNKPRRGLIVGRYQMFHKGHLNIIKFMESEPDVDEIIIGIGSSQYDRNHKHLEMPWITNPFTFDERKELVHEAIKDEIKKPYQIMPILDQHDHERWVNYVISIMPNFDYFYTNTKREKELFEKHGYEVRGIPIRDPFHAQTIREKIAMGENVEDYVPPGVIKFLHTMKGAKIIEELYREHGEEMIIVHNFYPDWEWRTFDYLEPEDKNRILGLPRVDKKNESDSYFVSAEHPGVNIKLRGDIFKVKKKLQQEGGYEKTAPYIFKAPVKKQSLEALFKDIVFTLPRNIPEYLDACQLRRMLSENKELGLTNVNIEKERIIGLYNACAIDFQKIQPQGSRETYFTVSIESRDKFRIEKAVKELGLEKYRPLDYTGFILEKILRKI
ncbi:adenylyltransferase/cytidyltransferase family protein [Candidatus Woesearchaeota archaeon]|nr:adenylyltransferase/cytidyltransferase family protein [Candidatus Woesearchaeota archaeon]